MTFVRDQEIEEISKLKVIHSYGLRKHSGNAKITQDVNNSTDQTKANGIKIKEKLEAVHAFCTQSHPRSSRPRLICIN